VTTFNVIFMSPLAYQANSRQQHSFRSIQKKWQTVCFKKFYNNNFRVGCYIPNEKI